MALAFRRNTLYQLWATTKYHHFISFHHFTTPLVAQNHQSRRRRKSKSRRGEKKRKKRKIKTTAHTHTHFGCPFSTGEDSRSSSSSSLFNEHSHLASEDEDDNDNDFDEEEEKARKTESDFRTAAAAVWQQSTAVTTFYSSFFFSTLFQHSSTFHLCFGQISSWLLKNDHFLFIRPHLLLLYCPPSLHLQPTIHRIRLRPTINSRPHLAIEIFASVHWAQMMKKKKKKMMRKKERISNLLHQFCCSLVCSFSSFCILLAF